MTELNKVVFIGAGNVATHMSQAFAQAGIRVLGIYSRKLESAKVLAEKLHAEWGSLSQIDVTEAQLIVIAVPDQFIEEVSKQIPKNNALIVHTSGSINLEVLMDVGTQIGVFYPLQTFSKDKGLHFSNIPIMLECSNEENYVLLENLAHLISERVYRINSLQRKKIHIAAVFSSNFTNYLVHIAEDLLEKENIPFDVIRPLIEETAAKLKNLKPYHAQTGPAVREDYQTIETHLRDLKNIPAYYEIYKLLSHQIIQSRKNKT